MINEHQSLRPETRDRVLAAIERLSYRPNRVAQALGSSRSRTLGVLALQRSYYGASAAVRGIETAAQDAGYLVSITNLSSSRSEVVQSALELLSDQMVDGLIIIAPQTRVLNTIDQLALDIPYVMLHSRASGDPHELFVDQVIGARAATRHLIDLGHRSIYHLAGPQEWIEAEARMQGFLQELSEADIPATPPIKGDWTADYGYYAGAALLREALFTAVFASNDQMALGLIHAFRAGGLSVPGDVSVVGFDDIAEAAHFWPPLTTVRQDFEDLGRQCVSRLLRAANGDSMPAPAALAPQLVVRDSTGPPPG